MKRIYVDLETMKKTKGKIDIPFLEIGNASNTIVVETSSILSEIITKKIVDNFGTFQTNENSDNSNLEVQNG